LQKWRESPKNLQSFFHDGMFYLSDGANFVVSVHDFPDQNPKRGNSLALKIEGFEMNSEFC